METTLYLIKFITLGGNINSVYVDATTQQRAELEFEKYYQFDQVLSITPED
jgi:hypothetical protein